MFFKRFYLDCLSHASYLVADDPGGFRYRSPTRHRADLEEAMRLDRIGFFKDGMRAAQDRGSWSNASEDVVPLSEPVSLERKDFGMSRVFWGGIPTEKKYQEITA